jgi:hypothetical protein
MPMMAKRYHRVNRRLVIGRASVDNKDTELRTKVLVFVLVVVP